MRKECASAKSKGTMRNTDRTKVRTEEEKKQRERAGTKKELKDYPSPSDIAYVEIELGSSYGCISIGRGWVQYWMGR